MTGRQNYRQDKNNMPCDLRSRGHRRYSMSELLLQNANLWLSRSRPIANFCTVQNHFKIDQTFFLARKQSVCSYFFWPCYFYMLYLWHVLVINYIHIVIVLHEPIMAWETEKVAEEIRKEEKQNGNSTSESLCRAWTGLSKCCCRTQ
jgi:hypothetical protein